MCPAFNAAYHNDCKISTDNPKHLVEIVEQWAREHPDKPEREQQKPEQGTVGYLNPAAFKEYYAPYQSVKDLKRLYDELADRIAKLEKDHAETMCKPKRTNKDVLLAAFPFARMDETRFQMRVRLRWIITMIATSLKTARIANARTGLRNQRKTNKT